MLNKKITIREQIEENELQTLSEFATKSKFALGRKNEEEPCSLRTTFQRDRDRILHSKAFRRLKHKTQVFFSPNDDHYRTRMTHTLEVSQVARTISKALRLNEDLTEAIALGHDLGHTPFGHAGERVLNDLVYGGFRHYEQSVRIVEVLEDLNLNKETIDGIYNHQVNTLAFTLEGQVVRLADKIAYINHDIDDSIRAGLIKIDDLPQDCVKYFSISRLGRLSVMVHDIVENSMNKNQIIMSDDCQFHLHKLREWMFKNVYLTDETIKEGNKARLLIKELFNYYLEMALKKAPYLSEQSAQRVVCDYISGMTDRYAIQKFEEHFIPTSMQNKADDSYFYKLIELNEGK